MARDIADLQDHVPGTVNYPVRLSHLAGVAVYFKPNFGMTGQSNLNETKNYDVVVFSSCFLLGSFTQMLCSTTTKRIFPAWPITSDLAKVWGFGGG